MEKPKVLILGGKYAKNKRESTGNYSNLTFAGCGFIGRNLVSYLISNELVSSLRIVDKVPPQVAWLSDNHNKYFNNPIVEFKSANLINEGRTRPFCFSFVLLIIVSR